MTYDALNSSKSWAHSLLKSFSRARACFSVPPMVCRNLIQPTAGDGRNIYKSPILATQGPRNSIDLMESCGESHGDSHGESHMMYQIHHAWHGGMGQIHLLAMAPPQIALEIWDPVISIHF